MLHLTVSTPDVAASEPRELTAVPTVASMRQLRLDALGACHDFWIADESTSVEISATMDESPWHQTWTVEHASKSWLESLNSLLATLPSTDPYYVAAFPLGDSSTRQTACHDGTR